jgi:2'-5' RNA ligase
MAGDDSGAFQAGQSGLIVRVPEAEPAVRAWRARLNPSARAGVPAHVTVLFPFLDESRIDDGARAAIGEVIGRHRSFEARFEHCGRFPGILYLVPEPDIPFRRLTEAIRNSTDGAEEALYGQTPRPTGESSTRSPPPSSSSAPKS